MHSNTRELSVRIVNEQITLCEHK